MTGDKHVILASEMCVNIFTLKLKEMVPGNDREAEFKRSIKSEGKGGLVML